MHGNTTQGVSMLNRLLLTSAIVLGSTTAYAQSFSENGWTLLYNQTTAANTTTPTP